MAETLPKGWARCLHLHMRACNEWQACCDDALESGPPISLDSLTALELAAHNLHAARRDLADWTRDDAD